MTLLLDTHVFLWSLIDTARLSALAKTAISDRANQVFVSAVTFWEISIKFGFGRLELHGVVPGDLPAEAVKAVYQLVPLEPLTAATAHQLPQMAHKDPFDRLLVWQAIEHGWTLVSRDREMAAYEVHGLKLLW